MTLDLHSLGMDFPRWQDAVEAAISSGNLEVTGEIRDGQLVQFTDPSGAQINILAAEPYATWSGFQSSTSALAHVTMINDVLALCELVTNDGKLLNSLTCNLAQGPLIVDEPILQWEQVALTALALQSTTTPSEADDDTFEPSISSPGAHIVTGGVGSQAPDASGSFAARVHHAEYRTNQLTGQRFVHVTVEEPAFFDVCLPETEAQLPAPGSILRGDAVFVASILPPAGCGDSCGSCGGGCGH